MSHDSAHSTGQRLNALRTARKWTQQVLAEKVGVSRTQLSAWENGQGITRENLVLLAGVFGVTPDDIGRAWTADEPRSRTSGIQKSRRSADSSSVAHSEEAGALMAGLSTLPDADLFEEVLAVWRLLRTADERRALVEQARSLLGTALATPQAASRKKAQR